MRTTDDMKTGPSRSDEPRTSKGQATKKRIISSAARLIHANGYKNTSLEDILAAAEIKKGSFYTARHIGLKLKESQRTGLSSMTGSTS